LEIIKKRHKLFILLQPDALSMLGASRSRSDKMLCLFRKAFNQSTPAAFISCQFSGNEKRVCRFPSKTGHNIYLLPFSVNILRHFLERQSTPVWKRHDIRYLLITTFLL
jgi:hypothetical protein